MIYKDHVIQAKVTTTEFFQITDDEKIVFPSHATPKRQEIDGFIVTSDNELFVKIFTTTEEAKKFIDQLGEENEHTEV